MKDIPIVLLTLSVACILQFGCNSSNGNDPKEPGELIDESLVTESYPGFIIDKSIDQPVSGLKVQFTQFLGDSYIHGFDSARTDANGFFNIVYSYDKDSLLSVAEATNLDTSNIHHRLELVTEDYLLITTLQNGTPLPVFKPKLVPDEIIDIEVYAAGLLQIEMVDTTNTDLYDQVDVQFTLLNPFPILFELEISNPNNEINRWDIALPANLDVLIETTISEGTDAASLSIVETRTDTVSLDFQEKSSFVIGH